MKKLLLILLCLPMIGFGQDKQIIYYPDGKAYKGTGKTFNQLNSEFAESGPIYNYTPNIEGFYTVGFKLFTKQPIYVATTDVTKIQSAIAGFNLERFFNSYDFEMELETHIDEGALTDLFIIETLGQPDNKSKYYDKEIEFKDWTYSDLGVTLQFINGIVTSYITTN